MSSAYWAMRGTRPSAPHDQRTGLAYIFGAICPAEGKAAGLVLPFCNTEAMRLHLDEISLAVAPDAHPPPRRSGGLAHLRPARRAGEHLDCPPAVALARTKPGPKPSGSLCGIT